MPTERLKCSTCLKNIQINGKKVNCYNKLHWFHRKCLPNFDEKDYDYAKDTNNLWSCSICNINNFPFNIIDDNEEFIKQSSNNVSISLLNSNFDLIDKILNPDELNREIQDQYLNDIDPDLNFFTQELADTLNSSNYTSVDIINKKLFDMKNPGFSVLNLNIRSAPKNLHSLKIMLENLKHNFSCIGLSETWLKDSNVDVYHLDGYKHEFYTRKKKQGGGVSIFIEKDLTYKNRVDLGVSNSDFEIIWVEIFKDNYKLQSNVIIGVIYRIPGTNINNFNEYMEEALNKIKCENKLAYFMGDFNIDLLNMSTHHNTSEFLDIVFTNSFLPLITKPTRITSTSATLIDNIFSNDYGKEEIFKGIIPEDISDHMPIFFIKQNNKLKKKEKNIIYMRKFNDINMKEFEKSLQNGNLDKVTEENSPKLAYEKFDNIISKAFETSFPLLEIVIKYNNKISWLTQGLKQSIKFKNKLFKISKIYPTDTNVKKYKTYKNNLNKLLKVAERDYYKQKLLKVKTNLRKTWDIIKGIINKKRTHTPIVKLLINGKENNNKNSISNQFVEFFTNVGKSLDEKIPKSNKDPIDYIKFRNEVSIYLNPCDEEELSKMIMSINDGAPGWDNMPACVLKKNICCISKSLTHLINLSLTNGYFPDPLKLANVIPIYKACEKMMVNNYRPISLLSIVSKVFEKVFYSRLYNFLKAQKILYKHQFGFREKHSTYMALLVLMDKIINAIEDNKFTIGIFLDFSKAFDTVNHEILLRKLDVYGVRGVANDWVRSYLSNRKQFVTVNGVKSKTMTIECGVPQGSILGPLLFLVYINDLATISTSMEMIMFADDSNFFATGENIEELTEKINLEINNITDWLQANRLSLNIKKTNFMVFSPRPRQNIPKITIKISNQTISQIEECRFLGVMIDNKLSWKAHIKHVSSKVAKSVGIISKARKILDKKTLETLYYTMIYPYLLYCNIIWGNCNATTIWPIFKLQKMAIRLITNTSRRESTSKHFKKLHLLKVPDLYDFNVSIFMHNFINENLPTTFEKYFILTGEVHNVATRQTNDYRVPFYKSQIGSKFLRKTGVDIWKSINDSYGFSYSLEQFKVFALATKLAEY